MARLLLLGKAMGVVVAVLCVWRITHLLSEERGPWATLDRLRARLGPGFLAELTSCFDCLSLWVAIPFSLLSSGSWAERLVLWRALSGGAILLERATAERLTGPPAIYAEDPLVERGA